MERTSLSFSNSRSVRKGISRGFRALFEVEYKRAVGSEGGGISDTERRERSLWRR